MHILIFSPHRGSAAMALPVAIAHWLSQGHRVTLLTVFSRSLEAPFSDADTVHPNDRLTYVSAMRRKEDEQFQRLHPKLIMLDLNLKEAAIRHRISAEDTFSLPASPADTAVEKIQKALAKLASGPASAVQSLVLPLGLGEHLDHRVVRDAVLSAERSRELPIAFYEDQPFAAQMSKTQTQEPRVALPRLADFDLSRYQPRLVGSENARSIRAKTLALYASQLDEQLAAETIAGAATHQDSDRIWTAPEWPVA